MGKTFLLFYSLILGLVYFLSLPILLVLSFKSKYRISMPSRFFLKNNTALNPDGIWFHSCSFGEAKAIEPLVRELPKDALRMTSITQTGHDANSVYTDESRYLPFEPLLFWWIKPQKALVVMEAEFWYLLFVLAHKRGAKTLLINARISERSFPKYKRMSFLYKQIFKHIDEVYAQTRLDKERLESLGARDVKVMGSLKLCDVANISTHYPKPEGIVVCAGSTHDKEEALILQAFQSLKKKKPLAKIIVVPRHPERFDVVERMMKAYGHTQQWSFSKLSENKAFDTDMILVDALGELVNCYAISDVVVLGGAFEPIGGHNAAEAAAFGCKIISGEHYFNQKKIFEEVAGIEIVSKDNLIEVLQYPGLLEATYIKERTDISELLQSLKSVL